jgi:Methyltransferase domain
LVTDLPSVVAAPSRLSAMVRFEGLVRQPPACTLHGHFPFRSSRFYLSLTSPSVIHARKRREKTKMASPIWQYDEFRGFALDFHDPREVDLYDARQGTDPDAENRIVRSLGISAEDIVIEYGAGTGAFLEAVAGICQRVHAVDVSRAMIEHARRRLQPGCEQCNLPPCRISYL